MQIELTLDGAIELHFCTKNYPIDTLLALGAKWKKETSVLRYV